MAIDYTTARGQVRLLIADTTEGAFLLDDAQVDGFLALEDQNVRLAAAQALDTIASSEVLVSKKITSQDLSTDGPAVAKALHEQATALRDASDDATIAQVVPAGYGWPPELSAWPVMTLSDGDFPWWL